MSNFRLQVFYSVATHLNFTKAAEEMFVTQPAITKNIKELEQELDVRLFDRVGGKVSLTEAGYILLTHTKKVLELDRELIYNLSSLKNKHYGHLCLGASTTIGQYVLPSILASFHKKFPTIELALSNGNTQQIEDMLIDRKVEIGIVEGSSHNRHFKYTPFIKDEIVAVAHKSQSLAKKTEISIDELKQTPIVLREYGSGSLEVITERLKEYGISLKDLNTIMHLGSTESIKSYQANSDCLSLISIHAVSKEIASGDFKIIDIKDFSIHRTFDFIHLHGKLSGLAELFMQFAQQSITKGYRA